MIMQSLAGRALLCLLAGSIFTLGLAPFDLKLLSLVSMAVFAFAPVSYPHLTLPTTFRVPISRRVLC